VLAGVLVVAAAACSLVGQAGLCLPWQNRPMWQLWQIRMLRILSASVVGAALAVAGTALQSLLRNPLASPFVLGISSGAGVGVLVGMTALSQTPLWAATPITAAIGGVGSMAVVYLIAQRRGRLDPYSLLLTGVIVNAFNGAVMLLLYLYANPFDVTRYITWAMGTIPESPTPELLGSTSALVALGWLCLFLRGHALNVQSLGDDVAGSSGVNVHRLRLVTFLIAGLTTAAAVALAGPVGFVGLIIPHICRMILGADHRRLMIASGFVGAVFLVLADTFCRSTVLRFGLELPVGVVTAFCGAPFFLVLLRRRFREPVQ